MHNHNYRRDSVSKQGIILSTKGLKWDINRHRWPLQKTAVIAFCCSATYLLSLF